MSTDPSRNTADPFFDAPANVQYVTDASGQTRIVETRVVQQPAVISYSAQPGTIGNVVDASRGATTSSYVVGDGSQARVANAGGVRFAPGADVKTYTTTNTVVQPSSYRVETTTSNTPAYVTTTQTRTVEQPVQITKTYTSAETNYAPSYQANAINSYEQNAPLIQGEKYTEGGYNFYDGDVDDVHTEQPVSGGPGLCGLLAGLLALLAALALVGLMGAIWHRSGTGCFSAVPLSHLILACVAAVVAALGLWVCFSARKDIANHVDVNHTLISIALLLALVFFAYFLASAVYMYMYRPFHYADLTGQKCGNNPQWNDHFGKDWTFEEGWGLHRRMLWWVALLSLVAAVGFLILAIALWLLTKFTVQTARIVLGAACLAAVILALFGINYFLQARTLLNNNYAMRNFKFSYLTTLLGLLAIGGIVLFFNAIWNLFKKRSGHFVFGTILIIFIFIFVCFLGLMLRAFRETQFSTLQNQSNGTCRDIISNFNSKCFSDYCPGGKYLPAGATCSKEFMASSWETDGSLRYVNPCCCNSFSVALLCPLYYAGIMSLLFVTAVIIAIAANYYLSDTSEYLEFSDRKFGIFELLFVIGIVLAIIGFGFYWGFKPADTICPQNPADPTINRDQFGNILSYQDPNFVPVDLNKVYNGTVPPSAYIQGAVRYTDPTVPVTLAQQSFDLGTSNPILTLNGNAAACGTSNCGWRVGVLVTNGKIANNFNGAVQGTSAARSLFFNDNNSNDDFVLLKGTQADVQNALNQLRFNAIDISKPTYAYFNAQQVDLLNLNVGGLQPNEAIPANVALDPNGNVFSPLFGYSIQDGGANAECLASNNCVSNLVCTSNCQTGFAFYSSNGFIDVVVPVQVTDVNGNLVPYNGNGLASNSYYVHQNTQYRLGNPAFAANALRFQVPRPLSGNLNLVLNVNDNNNQYLPYGRNTVIPYDAVHPYNLEPIQLLTKSGKGCQGASDVSACFATQKVAFGTVRIVVSDPETHARIANVPVKLLSGIDGVRTLVSSNSDVNGVATFNNVAYDYYTVQFDGNGSYLPARALLAVQDDKSSNFTLNLHQRGSGNTVLQQFVSNRNADQDFNLNIVSRSNVTCNVSPYNKYCGYASHINDVEDFAQGFENIRLYNFTESNYLAYLQNNAVSASTCGAYDLSQYGYYPGGQRASPRSLKFEWNNVRKAQAAVPTYQTLYCFNGWGLNTIRHWQTSGNTAVSAALCNQFWPEGSEWSLQRLHDLNSRK